MSSTIKLLSVLYIMTISVEVFAGLLSSLICCLVAQISFLIYFNRVRKVRNFQQSTRNVPTVEDMRKFIPTNADQAHTTSSQRIDS